MAIELEGNLLLDRTPTRRWVSIIAVTIPAAAFVMGAAWFIRAFVAPPTVVISSPMMLASAAPHSPAKPALVETRLPTQSSSVAKNDTVSAPSTAAADSAVSTALPMMATLMAAPPAAELPAVSAPSAIEPVTDGSSQLASEQSGTQASEPIAEPVPLPHPKPHFRVAMVTGHIPLPRPKPVEDMPPPDLPAAELHGVQ